MYEPPWLDNEEPVVRQNWIRPCRKCDFSGRSQNSHLALATYHPGRFCNSDL